MRIPRVIPALLLADDEFVKTVRFDSPRYIGDPVNTIDLFNQFEVDEIAVLDIDASVARRQPSFPLIEALAAQCWVPLTYGGGIADLDTARTVFGIGVEKVVLGSVLADRIDLAGEIAAVFGRQAVVAAVDVRTDADDPAVLVEHGRRVVSRDPAAYAAAAAAAGAGEILLQAVHRDGTREGFDLELIRTVTAAVDVPVIALGGAARRGDLRGPVVDAGAAAVAAGSLFVFQGRSGGVLVNFPTRDELKAIFQRRDL
jgi:cyclase